MELTQLIEHWEATLLLRSRVPRKQKVCSHTWKKHSKKVPKKPQTLTGWLIKTNTYNKFDQAVNKHNTCTVHINWGKVQEERKATDWLQQPIKTCSRIAAALQQVALFRPLSPKPFLTALPCRQVCYSTPSQAQPHDPHVPRAWSVTHIPHIPKSAVCKPFSRETQRAEEAQRANGKSTAEGHKLNMHMPAQSVTKTWWAWAPGLFSEQVSSSHFKFNLPLLVLASAPVRRDLHVWNGRNVFAVACSVPLAGCQRPFSPLFLNLHFWFQLKSYICPTTEWK